MSDVTTVVGPIPLTRSDRWVMAGLATVVVLLTQARPWDSHHVGQFHDDGIYVLTAKSLAEGRGYRVGHLPGEPPQTKYPPIYPVALTAVWRVFPEFPANVRMLEWVGVIGGAMAVAGGYGYLVRFGYAARPVAVLAAASVATSPAFLGMCTRLMAEMPFAVLLVAALWRADWAVSGWCGKSRTHLRCVADRVVTGMIVALPALCRVPGVVLVPVTIMLLWRTGRPARMAALGSAVTLAPWFLWVTMAGQRFASDPATGYYTDYVGWWELNAAGLGRIVGVNIYFEAQSVAHRSAEGLATQITQLPGGLVILAAVGLVAVPAALCDLRVGRPLACFLAVYLGLIACWPWPSARFVLPVQVLVAAYLFRPLTPVMTLLNPSDLMRFSAGTILRISREFAPSNQMDSTKQPVITRWWLAVPIIAVVVGANLWALSAVWEYERTNPDRAATERLLAWVRSETPVDAVIASPADPIIALYTGRTAFNPLVARPGPMFYGLLGEPLPSPEQLSTTFRAFGAGFVVHFPVTAGDESPYFDRYAALEKAGVFRLTYADPADKRFVVYRVLSP